MKANPLKAARICMGYTQQEMGKKLGLSTSNFYKKESNPQKFTIDERVKIARLYNLTFTQMNDLLFDGMLPMDMLTESDLKPGKSA